MKIAVVGSGGREHAILWRLTRDREKHHLFAVPGNGGTLSLAESVDADLTCVESLYHTLRRIIPDLVVVGPEAPLAAGITDLLLRANIPCFGPVASAAKLEASKVFAKQLMREHNVPTAEFEVFAEFATLERCLRQREWSGGWVVKADGLAAGKGAFVCDSREEALLCARALMVDGVAGEAGRNIVLERRLCGREVSALFLCDGERFVALPAAQDYKRAEDGDRGPNTGGMGSYCPAAHFTPAIRSEVETRIVAPVLHALASAGTPYRGVLYVGLMLTAGGPQVIEFNCRFGDPETQVILPGLPGEFGAMLLACATGRLADAASFAPHPERAVVCVVIAADGYPGTYRRGIPLTEVLDTGHAFTFHAGTQRTTQGLVSSGGRILNAVGTGASLAEARSSAYALAERLIVPGLRMRRDIAQGV